MRSAPTSLYGIVVTDTADSAGIALNPLTLFGAALGANLVLLVVAYVLFGRRASLRRTVAVGTGAQPDGSGGGGDEHVRDPFEPIHRIAALAMLGLVAVVVGQDSRTCPQPQSPVIRPPCRALGRSPDRPSSV